MKYRWRDMKYGCAIWCAETGNRQREAMNLLAEARIELAGELLNLVLGDSIEQKWMQWRKKRKQR